MESWTLRMSLALGVDAIFLFVMLPSWPVVLVHTGAVLLILGTRAWLIRQTHEVCELLSLASYYKKRSESCNDSSLTTLDLHRTPRQQQDFAWVHDNSMEPVVRRRPAPEHLKAVAILTKKRWRSDDGYESSLSATSEPEELLSPPRVPRSRTKRLEQA
ncbi:hypothetical protein ACHHYP_20051 [Achlya hypogyna]|uniref:Uncharacterized protein n=1 Tax=Achlya hypogyna TaxID=1202772 RepID=A0A1V9ZUE2_ACHHY|nr:hypothetical protein ACHHYP_20051 [Achlya hypogyna]